MADQPRDCVALTIKAARDLLSKTEVTQLVKELTNTVKRKEAAGQLANLEEEMAKLARDMADESVFASKIEKRNRLVNMMVERNADQYVQRFVDKGLRYHEGFEAILVGTNKVVAGARLSAEARQKEYSRRLLGTLMSALKQRNVLEFFTDPRAGIERNVAVELFEMDKPKGRPGITDDPVARKVAEAIALAQEEARRLTNLAGANIRKMPGYIVRQVHDPRAMTKAGYEEWKRFVLPLLDVRKTFSGMDAESGLQVAYRHLTTGRDMFLADQLEPGETGFTGPGNLAKRLSEARVLHFKDGGSWWQYNERFGRRFLNESVISGLEQAGNHIGLMQVLGTNPENMLQKLVSKYALQAQIKGDMADINRLQGGYMRNLYAQISGQAQMVESWNIAYAGSVVRAVQSTAKLGGALISSITDIMTAASELRYQGKGVLSSYADLMKERTANMTKDEQGQFYDLLGVGMDGLVGGIVARFHANDMLPGQMARLQQSFFKLNGLQWWTNSWQKAVAAIMSRDLAGMAPMGFDKLTPEYQRLLGQFDITAAEWDLYRQSVTTFPDGRSYMTPDLVRNLSDDQIKAHLGEGEKTPREIELAKDLLESKLRSLILDRTDYAVLKPDARTNAILNAGLKRGTALGETLRMLTQFKAFPFAMLQKVWAREIYGSGANSLSESLLKGKGDIRGMAHILAMSTVFGYLAMTAKDALKGREPRDPLQAATWAASFIQGGGAGIYGDFMFGQATRYGNSALATLGGPTASSMEDLIKLYGRAINGDDTAAQGLKFAVSHIPFNNLFWLKPALDYMFLYDLQEAINPGAMGRMEGFMKKNNDQEFWLKPTQDRLRPFTG
ncbi:structural protein [uncultured Caudovirales phage]|uniref:Structural protein n=1 Tax=uncultured Caudovirales phage TaxID=2100421 RepID=A0A6J5LT49_9CAUD|nr:structural protein [uncultured Caudovirales phage]